MNALLSIKDLTVVVHEDGRERRLVDGVSFDIPNNSISAFVGGSGSGKTTTGLSILKLLPLGLTVSKGQILFDGDNLLNISESKMRARRGKDISMIFQEPLNAFNPVFTIGYQIEEVLRMHTKLSKNARKARILDLLKMVELSDPSRVMNNYPHQLSGGMRQRAMIAQAIAASPKLIIADEPTSNLDVTLQAKIMDLFRKLKNELNLSILLITHDLALVSHLSDYVAVMTNGQVVESGTTKQITTTPQNEYTKQLMKAL